MIKTQDILTATDFGEASESALAYGRELARSYGARQHVLNVSVNALGWAGPESINIDIVTVQAEIDKEARRKLDNLLNDEDRRDLRAVAVVRNGNTPAYEIVTYARDAKIDLIVIGTHGRGAMAHLVMGSVAEKVVRTAPCPVLTVRHPEHEFVLPDALQVVTATRQS
jgi:nucleotide-binding universal stress UspA family protein